MDANGLVLYHDCRTHCSDAQNRGKKNAASLRAGWELLPIDSHLLFSSLSEKIALAFRFCFHVWLTTTGKLLHGLMLGYAIPSTLLTA